jgi:hypothetical protein
LKNQNPVPNDRVVPVEGQPKEQWWGCTRRFAALMALPWLAAILVE